MYSNSNKVNIGYLEIHILLITFFTSPWKFCKYTLWLLQYESKKIYYYSIKYVFM